MARLIAITALLGLAFLLFKYRTNEKLQKGVVIALISGFVIYTISLMTTELLR
ncbi:hypothetical protein [Vibrio hippocampi]|uniref:Uncharacterized protein n=1 Tax=Vibrio hippocampi TaxID=654686 RepID=A0ABM8ZIH7_9VIBR|nr:hypothetical protein [Vibrio hippocampi]CAH0526033.1 hypothetical protein VHP8226_01517 [Vibrio hippocampi]